MAWMAQKIGASQSLLTRWRAGAEPRTIYFLKVCAVLATIQDRHIYGVLSEGAAVLGIDLNDLLENIVDQDSTDVD